MAAAWSASCCARVETASASLARACARTSRWTGPVKCTPWGGADRRKARSRCPASAGCSACRPACRRACPGSASRSMVRCSMRRSGVGSPWADCRGAARSPASAESNVPAVQPVHDLNRNCSQTGEPTAGGVGDRAVRHGRRPPPKIRALPLPAAPPACCADSPCFTLSISMSLSLAVAMPAPRPRWRLLAWAAPRCC